MKHAYWQLIWAILLLGTLAGVGASIFLREAPVPPELPDSNPQKIVPKISQIWCKPTVQDKFYSSGVK
jgi:hypothetical protein